LPAPEQLAAQSTANRQGRGAVLAGEDARQVMDVLRRDAEQAYADYEWMLNEGPDGQPADPARQGLARELARMNLTLNTYTQWYWKTDLHNLLHFLSLRADAHAQYEIRVYAEAMLDTVRRWVPMTARAFEDYRLGGMHLSGPALAVVRRLLAGEPVDQGMSGLSPREWRELMAGLGR
jgi:thymidylate synthase (FAD)